jgi:protein involved in polysaccharide export with SLBB domain
MLTMKVSIKTKRILGSCCLLLLSLFLGGCEHLYYADPNPEKPYVFPSESQVGTAKPWTPPSVATPSGAASVGGGPALVPVSTSQSPNAQFPPTSATSIPPRPGSPGDLSSSVLQKGDTVTIAFSDLPQPIPERKERIPDDGKLTLPFNVVVKADGKTAFQLEREIEKEYVPKYYVRLTVSVKPEDRYYFVGGEVKIQNRQQYIGRMTVLRAIDTAGGFTDFANRKKIEVRRSGGDKSNVNWYEAVKDPSKDPEVFPNDQIIVHKKWF